MTMLAARRLTSHSQVPASSRRSRWHRRRASAPARRTARSSRGGHRRSPGPGSRSAARPPGRTPSRPACRGSTRTPTRPSGCAAAAGVPAAGLLPASRGWRSGPDPAVPRTPHGWRAGSARAWPWPLDDERSDGSTAARTTNGSVGGGRRHLSGCPGWAVRGTGGLRGLLAGLGVCHVVWIAPTFSRGHTPRRLPTTRDPVDAPFATRSAIRARWPGSG